ncbi:MAG: hypothetical protein K8R23_13470 [Chthoniobacter sp.]|nr:hypothetical protein [Chthoniobacter sp.]
MKQIATDEPTPEHLLNLLDSELAMQRAQTESPSRRRLMFLTGGVLFIVIAAAAALLVLMQMLSDLERAPRPLKAETASCAAGGKF